MHQDQETRFAVQAFFRFYRCLKISTKELKVNIQPKATSLSEFYFFCVIGSRAWNHSRIASLDVVYSRLMILM